MTRQDIASLRTIAEELAAGRQCHKSSWQFDTAAELERIADVAEQEGRRITEVPLRGVVT